MSSRIISHYRILSRLGAGGMGEVYLAEDTKLDRRVALKLLPPASVADEQAKKRLIREAKAAATLDHPNICAIHEIGEEDGRSFIVMQYVEGETLAGWVKGKPLGLAEALGLAAQIADALAAAHSKGIIHRDIKPQNIMITPAGQVKVLDFGLAKVIRETSLLESSSETESLLTEAGTVMGTVPYMSPEQVRGESLDTRSDIFSFGALLYEMVSGRQPFAAETTAATFSTILTREPAPLARYSREAPIELERIVSKSLAKNKEQRYQTARDLLIDLTSLKRDLEFDVELQRSRNRDSSPAAYASVETVALATDPEGERAGNPATARTTNPESRSQVKRHKRLIVATLVVVTAGALFGIYTLALSHGWIAAGSKPAESTLRSMAVLPFSQLGAGESDGYLELGMADVLITRLSNLSQIVVRPTDAVLKYAAHGEDLAAGRELGVDLLLTGRMQRAGDRIRVTVQLVSVKDGHPVWAEQFDEKFTDLFTVEDSISQKVVKALTLKLTAEEQQRMAKRYTQNADAYQEYLKGRFYFLQYTPDGFTQAVTHLNQAIAMDPTYALAYAGLADAHTTASEWLLPPREAMAKAKAAALKALSFDETLAEAHAALGHVKVHELDPAAEQELQRALELNPNAVTTLLWYGEFFFMTRDWAKSVGTLQRAQQLDPLSSTVTLFLSWAYFWGGQPEPALREALKAIELDPNNPNAHATVALTYEHQGKYPEALAEIEKAMQLAPIPAGRAAVGRISALSGKRREAQKIIAELSESSQRQYVSPYDVATIYAALGDKDQAFTWLDKAYEDRSEWFGLMTSDFRMDSLRSDPRFDALLQRVGLTR